MMIKIKDSKGFYKPGHVNGWFVSFFPFNKDGDRIYDSVSTNDELQNEIQKVPFKLNIIGQGSFDCTFLAGFVGLTQDEKTASIKPEIGWFIKKDGVSTEIAPEVSSDSENNDDKDEVFENNCEKDYNGDSDSSDDGNQSFQYFDDEDSDVI